MAELRSPGVYFEADQPRVVPLGIIEMGVVGFLGLATRGPLDRPLKITNFKEFQETYGAPAPGSVLSHAVRGYFESGGRKCHVLRIAHARKESSARNEAEDFAEKARLVLVDEEFEATLELTAIDEGKWGNSIKAQIERNKSTNTLLTLDAEKGATEIVVKRAGDIARGALVRLDDGEKHEFVTVHDVRGKTLFLSSPLKETFRSWSPTTISEVQFDLVVSMGHMVEKYRNLSLSETSQQHVVRVVNDQSRLVRARDLRSSTPAPGNLPRASEQLYLQGGADGIANVNPADFIGYDHGPGRRRGIWAFSAIEEVDLLSVPDLFPAAETSSGFASEADTLSVQEALVTFCEESQEHFALLDFPRKTTIEDALEWRRRFDSSYCAFYFPWIHIHEGNNDENVRIVPPTGHVAGLYSKTDAIHGVYKVAANERIDGAFDLALNANEEHQAMLNDAGVNVIRAFAGKRGIRTWGGRTGASDPQWRFVNVRRIFILLRKALQLGTQWVVFEPNNHALWKTLIRQVSNFLTELWTKGYLVGAAPEEAFYVKCDEETNPAETRDSGYLIVEIGCAPVRPAEFIVFRISQRLEVQSGEAA